MKATAQKVFNLKTSFCTPYEESRWFTSPFHLPKLGKSAIAAECNGYYARCAGYMLQAPPKFWIFGCFKQYVNARVELTESKNLSLLHPKRNQSRNVNVHTPDPSPRSALCHLVLLPPEPQPPSLSHLWVLKASPLLPDNSYLRGPMLSQASLMVCSLFFNSQTYLICTKERSCIMQSTSKPSSLISLIYGDKKRTEDHKLLWVILRLTQFYGFFLTSKHLYIAISTRNTIEKGKFYIEKSNKYPENCKAFTSGHAVCQQLSFTKHKPTLTSGPEAYDAVSLCQRAAAAISHTHCLRQRQPSLHQAVGKVCPSILQHAFRNARTSKF